MVDRSAFQDIVAMTVGVPPHGTRSFAARISHLKTLNFPPMPRVGRGVKAEYRGAELLATSIVFELGQAFIVPAHAIRIVVDGWPEIALGFGDIASTIMDKNPALGWMRIIPHGLSELGDEALGSRNPREQGTFEIGFLGEDNPGNVLASDRTTILIDAARLYGDLVASALSTGHVSAEEIELDIRRSAFGTEVDPVRIDGRDQYWRRAMRLFESDEVRTLIQMDQRARLSPQMLGIVDYLDSPQRRDTDKRNSSFRGDISFIDAVCCLLTLTSENTEKYWIPAVQMLQLMRSLNEDADSSIDPKAFLHRELLDLVTRKLRECDGRLPPAQKTARVRRNSLALSR